MATKRAKKTAAKRVNPEPELPTQSGRPATVDVLIVGEYPNPMWLKALDDQGKAYKVRIPKRFQGKMLKRRLTVEAIDGELEEYYKYEP